MAFTNFPNGLSSLGIPLIGSGGNIPASTGNYFFVDSATGSDGNPGNEPAEPKATIAGAISAATASNGDVIVLMPGHTETVNGTTDIIINKAGLYIVGLGTGRLRPTINYSTAIGASVDITAANTTIDNVVFDPTGFGAVTAAINITAADVTLINCEMVISTGTNAPVRGILTAATAARLRVENCRFFGPATSTQTCTAAISHEVGIDYIIRGCEFKGKFTQAILNAATILGGLIDSNRFVIGTGTVAITMAAASTPFIVNNRINVPSGTAPITAAAGFVAGNIYSAAAGVTAGTAATI